VEFFYSSAFSRKQSFETDILSGAKMSEISGRSVGAPQPEAVPGNG
jgi:hypothetical protein